MAEDSTKVGAQACNLVIGSLVAELFKAEALRRAYEDAAASDTGIASVQRLCAELVDVAIDLARSVASMRPTADVAVS
jgi:hypothetical protein